LSGRGLISTPSRPNKPRDRRSLENTDGSDSGMLLIEGRVLGMAGYHLEGEHGTRREIQSGGDSFLKWGPSSPLQLSARAQLSLEGIAWEETETVENRVALTKEVLR